ncbi:hypothetical protein BpHYR1_043774 [Brachionus plicatilis]|uniref:Uncharacterized protein n=1 Tax=Brachionus plicatilis TaxID=10195 RepID=A0A3M7RKE9_BRAPC|nr:hypothetical protein BpHYR1_043774 [Brachionus plicatilis]
MKKHNLENFLLYNLNLEFEAFKKNLLFMRYLKMDKSTTKNPFQSTSFKIFNDSIENKTEIDSLIKQFKPIKSNLERSCCQNSCTFYNTRSIINSNKKKLKNKKIFYIAYSTRY